MEWPKNLLWYRQYCLSRSSFSSFFSCSSSNIPALSKASYTNLMGVQTALTSFSTHSSGLLSTTFIFGPPWLRKRFSLTLGTSLSSNVKAPTLMSSWTLHFNAVQSSITRMVITSGIFVVPFGVRGLHRWYVHKDQRTTSDQLRVKFCICHGNGVKLGPILLRSRSFYVITLLSWRLKRSSICRCRKSRKTCHWPKIGLVVSLWATPSILIIWPVVPVWLSWLKGIIRLPLVWHRMRLSFLLFKDWLLCLCAFYFAQFYPVLNHFSRGDHVWEIGVWVFYHSIIIRCR